MSMNKSSVKYPKVSLIVATLMPELGIGYKGQLPWSLKQEMKYFRKLTTTTIDPDKRNAVVMGRKTYNSIPPKFRPLKNRLNVVLTRNPKSLVEEMKEELDANKGHLQISGSLPNTLQELKKAEDNGAIEEIFIIGGAEVYNQLMRENYDLIDCIYLTEVRNEETLDMDAFFELDQSKWSKCESAVLHCELEAKKLHKEFELVGNNENGFTYDFTLWKKKGLTAHKVE
ncbi:uncharacterized protein C5L36_0D04100 [Pichia kudriavzevii]|uniref:Dihydrofolate reductase n=2 Tax=Pichia kudriavzevii TaxID=4909 RepID=A0A2U9R9X2_PICKU|nr:uncharacterized protein C5L36_0D04100 [Pichia kudriavzevii]AWU77679.1 hypothetical protein C5L36_0D04100 [Pichia kudriavzevii]